MGDTYGAGSSVLLDEVSAPTPLTEYGVGSSVLVSEVLSPPVPLPEYGRGSFALVREVSEVTPDPEPSPEPPPGSWVITREVRPSNIPSEVGLGSQVVVSKVGVTLYDTTLTVWSNNGRRPVTGVYVVAGGKTYKAGMLGVEETPPHPPLTSSYGLGSPRVTRNIFDPLYSPVPSGYTRDWVMRFDSPNWRVLAGDGSVITNNAKSLWNLVHTTHQGGTVSGSSTANVINDQNGWASWIVTTTPTGGQPYGSAYSSTKSSFYQPLTGRYEVMMRPPLGHSLWQCFWMNAGGSAARFEIDAAEMFYAQVPGKTVIAMHSQWYGGPNLDNRAYGGTFEWHTPHNSTKSWVGPSIGTTRYGRAVDWCDPLLSEPPWVKVTVDISKVWNVSRTAYTIRVVYYWNDRKILTYTDPFNPNTGTGPSSGEGTYVTPPPQPPSGNNYSGNKPVWVQDWIDKGNTESKFWDIRFDHWVGGNYIGAALDSGPPFMSGSKLYTYNGYLQIGDAGGASGIVQSATLDRWPLSLDIAWVQRLVPV